MIDQAQHLVAAAPGRNDVLDVVVVEDGADPIPVAREEARQQANEVRPGRTLSACQLAPNAIEGLRSSKNHAITSRSCMYWRTYGVFMRAVTFQSMWRTSSGG